jgi:hypothetical protein
MQQALLSRFGMGGPVMMSSVGRPALNGHRCPFLKAAKALSPPAIPALVQQFRAYCPFLRSTDLAAPPSANVAPAEPIRQFSAAPTGPIRQFERQFSASAAPKLSEQDYEESNTSAAAPAAPKISLVPREQAPTADAEADSLLGEKINQLKKEGRYREFFAIERKAGNYPRALRHDKDLTSPDEVGVFLCSPLCVMFVYVSVWCSLARPLGKIQGSDIRRT